MLYIVLLLPQTQFLALAPVTQHNGSVSILCNVVRQFIILIIVAVRVGTALVQTQPTVNFHQLVLSFLQSINVLCNLSTVGIVSQNLVERQMTGVGLVVGSSAGDVAFVFL